MLTYSPSRHGVGILVVVVLVALAVVVGFVISWIGWYLYAPKTTYRITAYQGQLQNSAAFPPTVTAPVTVVYQVKSRTETRPESAGLGHPPLDTGPALDWKNIRGVAVTFKLKRGDALFSDGSQEMTVVTNVDGIAAASLAPARNGSDELSFSYITDGTVVPDNEIKSFEVVKSP